MDYNYFSKEILDYLIAKLKGYFDYLAEHCGGGSGSAQKVIFHTYTNAVEYKISNKNVQLMSMAYASNKDTTALFNATIQFDMSSDGYVIFTYQIGTKVIDEVTHYLPKGKSIVTLTRYIPSGENELVVLRLYAKTAYYASDVRQLYSLVNRTAIDTTVPTAIVVQEGIRAALQAQGISAEAMWDGNIDIEEEINGFSLHQILSSRLGFGGIQEELSVDTQVPIPKGIEEAISGFTLNQILPKNIGFGTVEDSITVTTKNV